LQKLLIALLGGVGVVLAFLAINASLPNRPVEWSGVIVQFVVGTLALYIFYPDKKRKKG
jgi:hypothetical protein